MNTPTFTSQTIEKLAEIDRLIDSAQTAQDVYLALQALAYVLPNNYDLGYLIRKGADRWVRKNQKYSDMIWDPPGPPVEHCIICGKETAYTYNVDINYRYGYVEGAGQLCRDCYDTTLNK